LRFFDSSIFDFCLDGAQEIEGGGRTDPTSIRRFFDFSIYVWTGSYLITRKDHRERLLVVFLLPIAREAVSVIA
jgi:hypothetical protein